MNTKLTLSIEDTLIKKAKLYARREGRSLSDIIENYLKVIIKEDKTLSNKSTPITNSLKGSFNLPKDFDYKKEISEILTDKYL